MEKEIYKTMKIYFRFYENVDINRSLLSLCLPKVSLLKISLLLWMISKFIYIFYNNILSFYVEKKPYTRYAIYRGSDRILVWESVWKLLIFAFLLLQEDYTIEFQLRTRLNTTGGSLKRTFRYRRQAFDANMTRDYVLESVSMDNPQLIAYIRQVHLKSTTHQDPLNANETSEEKYVVSLSQGKREGVYVEYISRVRNLPF